MRDKYYPDGATRITAPFYTCICPAGHKVWSITHISTCYACGKELIYCEPSDQFGQKKAASGNWPLSEKNSSLS